MKSKISTSKSPLSPNKSTKSAKRRKFKEKKEDIQKIFNKLASIARENLRQITQNDNPSSRELLTTFKGIEVLSGTKEVDGERIPGSMN